MPPLAQRDPPGRPSSAPVARVLHAVVRYGELSETFVSEVVSGLERCGWEAWVASERGAINRDLFPDPPDSRILQPGRPRVWTRAMVRALRAADRPVRDRRARQWRPLVDRVAPSIVHVHFGWLAATVAFERFGPPVIVSFHGSDVRSWPHLTDENRRAFGALLGRLDVGTASSHFIASELRSLGYERRLEVIPPGVPLERFPFREPRDGTTAPRLLFVGRQVECKGLDVLLEALPSVLGRHPETSLTVVGAGIEEKRNAELVAKLRLGHAVRFRGALPHHEVAAELRAADVLVVPSRTTRSGQAEGSPVAPKEALATGLPVIATACGGLPEVIPPGQRGELVPEGDARALGAAISSLIERPSTWRSRAAEGRAWVVRQFDSNRLVGRLADLYADVATSDARAAAGESRTSSKT